jgi:hypothetical protein
MYATIDVRLTVSIDDDKTIPLATLVEFITDQNVESVLPRTGFVFRGQRRTDSSRLNRRE